MYIIMVGTHSLVVHYHLTPQIVSSIVGLVFYQDQRVVHNYRGICIYILCLILVDSLAILGHQPHHQQTLLHYSCNIESCIARADGLALMSLFIHTLSSSDTGTPSVVIILHRISVSSSLIFVLNIVFYSNYFGCLTSGVRTF